MNSFPQTKTTYKEELNTTFQISENNDYKKRNFIIKLVYKSKNQTFGIVQCTEEKKTEWLGSIIQQMRYIQ